MTGTGTAIADDPQLTCRLPGLERSSPVRVLLDRQLRVPMTARLITEARQVPTWMIALPSADPAKQQALRDAGVDIIEGTHSAAGQLDLAAALQRLGERGVTRLLVEGGGQLGAALLREGLVDRLVWLHAPVLLGEDGVPAVGALDYGRLAAAPAFELLSIETVGADVLTTFAKR
jgi:diaminohydroxyphosphoribosylaminopyrimidine deaminase/5-amino-6-(5-phosphoribosylamino)uracil reductase